MLIRDVALLGARATLGGYLAAHGAQKLWGHFDGPGLDQASAGFEHMGLRPGRAMATLASVSEVTGGVLTATGLAWPLGPIAIGSTMATASTTHRPKGPFSAKGGFELPLTNLAAAIGLGYAGPGWLSLDKILGVRVPRWFSAIVLLGGAATSAYTANLVISRQRELDLTEARKAEEAPIAAGD